jgi:hypothetical protein
MPVITSGNHASIRRLVQELRFLPVREPVNVLPRSFLAAIIAALLLKLRPASSSPCKSIQRFCSTRANRAREVEGHAHKIICKTRSSSSGGD